MCLSLAASPITSPSRSRTNSSPRWRVQATEATVRAERLEARVKSLSDELAVKCRHAWWGRIGQNGKRCSRRRRRSPPPTPTVLLAGESGTGKEVVATVHPCTPRIVPADRSWR